MVLIAIAALIAIALVLALALGAASKGGDDSDVDPALFSALAQARNPGGDRT
jgi:hypothetical protein